MYVYLQLTIQFKQLSINQSITWGIWNKWGNLTRSHTRASNIHCYWCKGIKFYCPMTGILSICALKLKQEYCIFLM